MEIFESNVLFNEDRFGVPVSRSNKVFKIFVLIQFLRHFDLASRNSLVLEKTFLGFPSSKTGRSYLRHLYQFQNNEESPSK